MFSGFVWILFCFPFLSFSLHDFICKKPYSFPSPMVAAAVRNCISLLLSQKVWNNPIGTTRYGLIVCQELVFLSEICQELVIGRIRLYSSKWKSLIKFVLVMRHCKQFFSYEFILCCFSALIVGAYEMSRMRLLFDWHMEYRQTVVLFLEDQAMRKWWILPSENDLQHSGPDWLLMLVEKCQPNCLK